MAQILIKDKQEAKVKKFAFSAIFILESSGIFGIQQSVNISNPVTNNPIMEAVKNNNFEEVKHATKKVYNKIWNSNAILPFLCAYKNKHQWSNKIVNGHLDPLHKKLAIILDTPDEEGNIPLSAAIRNNNLLIVKYLVEHGADVNKEDYGNTPLFAAVREDNEDIVKYLVEHNAKINTKNMCGETPLLAAVKEGNKNIVKYLIEHGADVNAGDYGNTPLFAAVRENNENIVKYLVKHSAEINKKNACGETPLFAAVKKGNENIVKYLVEHGADINKEDYWGKTPLHIAVDNKNEEIVKYLAGRGAETGKQTDILDVMTKSDSYRMLVCLRLYIAGN